MKTKICKKCGRELPLNNGYFRRRKERQDGFNGVCLECQGRSFKQIRIVKYEDIKDYIKDNKCELITKKEYYKDSKQELSIKCDCGNIFKVCFSNFKRSKNKSCDDCKKKLHRIEMYNEVKRFVEENSNCKMLSNEFVDNKHKIKFLCNCGKEFETNFNSFKSGNKRQCNDCAMNMRVLKRIYKYEDIKEYIEYNSDCKVLFTEYYGQDKEIRLRCGCGNEFITTFDKFKNKNKRQCDDCGRLIGDDARRLRYEDVKRFIEIDSNSGCKLLSKKYKTQNDNLLIECKCGNSFKASYLLFKTKKRKCRECVLKDIRKERGNDFGDIVSFIDDETNCKILSKPSDYENQNSVLKFKCLCGEIFESSWRSFASSKNKLCPKCTDEIRSKSKTKSNEEFLSKVYEAVGNEYTFLEEYKNVKEKITVKHNECGHIYQVTPDGFLNNGRRCPNCMCSKGEAKIGKILEKYDIKFLKQYIFDDLVGVQNGFLRFDFAIFNNDKLMCLIEYDGEQHFNLIEGLMNQQDFERLQEHDKRKNKYCKEHNLSLIRIPYYDFGTIEEILIKELNIDTDKETC